MSISGGGGGGRLFKMSVACSEVLTISMKKELNCFYLHC